MKKKMLVLFLLFLTTGCTMIQKESNDHILDAVLSTQNHIQNVYRAGYKYYLPKGIKLLKHEGNNEIFAGNGNTYYMYVDSVSYFHQVKKDYQEKQDVVFSRKVMKDDLFGYVEIKNASNDKYFVEIMYNYAKIEVMIEKDSVQEVLAYTMMILSSISYQDDVLGSLLGEDVLKANEIEHNIFESAETESEYLQIVEEYGQYEEKDDVVDPDFIRR